MGWFSARNLLTAVSFIPVIGVVGQAGTMIMDASDPEMRANKSWLDWGSDIAGLGLCFIPGGKVAQGAVKVASIACKAVDKGTTAYYAYEGASHIYENGVNAGDAASVLALVSGKGKLAQAAEKASTATSIIATTHSLAPESDPHAVNCDKTVFASTEGEDKKTSVLDTTKREEDDIARAAIAEKRAADEQAAKDTAIAKKETKTEQPNLVSQIAGGLVMVALAIASKASNAVKSVGNQVEGQNASGLERFGLTQEQSIV